MCFSLAFMRKVTWPMLININQQGGPCSIMWASLVYFRLLLTKLWGIMCFSLVSMLDFMGQNLTPLKSRLSKLQSWHQNFSCLVGPNEHFYTRCLLSARTSHGTTFAPRLSRLFNLLHVANVSIVLNSQVLKGGCSDFITFLHSYNHMLKLGHSVIISL